MTARYRRFATGEIVTVTFHGNGYATLTYADGYTETTSARDVSLAIDARLLEHVKEHE